MHFPFLVFPAKAGIQPEFLIANMKLLT